MKVGFTSSSTPTRRSPMDRRTREGGVGHLDLIRYQLLHRPPTRKRRVSERDEVSNRPYVPHAVELPHCSEEGRRALGTEDRGDKVRRFLGLLGSVGGIVEHPLTASSSSLTVLPSFSSMSSSHRQRRTFSTMFGSPMSSTRRHKHIRVFHRRVVVARLIRERALDQHERHEVLNVDVRHLSVVDDCRVGGRESHDDLLDLISLYSVLAHEVPKCRERCLDRTTRGPRLYCSPRDLKPGAESVGEFGEICLRGVDRKVVFHSSAKVSSTAVKPASTMSPASTPVWAPRPETNALWTCSVSRRLVMIPDAASAV